MNSSSFGKSVGEMLDRLGAQVDTAYTERNACVALLASMELANGWRVGLARTDIPGWEPCWHNCVYIELPFLDAGQVSWHYHDRDANLFAHLPPYEGEWDGHTTLEKYLRVRKLARIIVP